MNEIKRYGFLEYSGEEFGTTVTITDCLDKSIKRVTIPSKIHEKKVTTIGANAFAGCENLKKVFIPDTVSKIDMFTFYGCENLKEVFIPDTVSEINMFAFCGCKKLEWVFIPDGVRTIGTCAFYDTSLHNIQIPKSVEYIGENAFSKTKLFENEEKYLDGCFFGVDENSFTSENYWVKKDTRLIANGAFGKDSTLKRVYIPSTVKIICDGAFRKQVEILNIPNIW